MSKVVRISDGTIKLLEDYRKSRIECAKLLLSSCSSYQADIKRYEQMSYSDLVEDSILFALVSAEQDVKDLSKCHTETF